MEEKLDIISKKLSVIISQLAALPAEGAGSKETIAKLDGIGLSNTEIASILGIGAASVAVAKSRMKKNGAVKNGE